MSSMLRNINPVATLCTALSVDKGSKSQHTDMTGNERTDK